VNHIMTGARHHLWLFLVLAFAAPVYVLWTWSDQVGQFGNDGPNYLMMALHYSPFAKAPAVFDQTAALSRFPPLYPLMLAWAGAGAGLHWVHELTTLFLMAGLVAFYVWLCVQRCSPAQAALLTLLVAALPGSWLLGLTVQSEFLYLFWSLLALTLLALHVRRPHDELLYVAALTVAAAALTRTIGIALYLPLLLAAARTQRRTGLLALAIAALPMLVWHLLHRADIGYTDALGSMYATKPLAALREQLSAELPALRKGLIGNFMTGSPPLRFGADALGAACLAATVWRALRRELEALYLAAYLAILLFWPYPEESGRFLWVILPLALVQPVLLLAGGCRAKFPSAAGGAPDARRPAMLTCALAGLILLLSLPTLSLASERYRNAPYSGVPGARGLLAWYSTREPGEAAHRSYSQAVIIDAMRRIADEIPARDCVLATRPDLVNYFGLRRSVFTPVDEIPDPYFQRELHAPGCKFVFMSTALDGRYPVLLHPLKRLGDKIRVLDYVQMPDPPPGNRSVTCILAEID
jgi:uncharacterized membrane protein YhaH (DUF805 family)